MYRKRSEENRQGGLITLCVTQYHNVELSVSSNFLSVGKFELLVMVGLMTNLICLTARSEKERSSNAGPTIVALASLMILAEGKPLKKKIELQSPIPCFGVGKEV